MLVDRIYKTPPNDVHLLIKNRKDLPLYDIVNWTRLK